MGDNELTDFIIGICDEEGGTKLVAGYVLPYNERAIIDWLRSECEGQ
jgi:hypothetical protein